MRCKKCILTDSFPKIKFNEEGICNYCLHEEKKRTFIKEEEIHSIIKDELHRIRGKYDYDAILLYSGGKDSTYTLKLAVEKYNLNILAFTYDNGFLSEEARKNILNVVDSLNCDHLFFKPKKKNFINLSNAVSTNNIYPKQSKTRISDICQACINSINIKAVELALEKNIPLIIAGFTSGQIPKNSILYEFKYNTITEFREAENNKILQLGGESLKSFLFLTKKNQESKEFPKYLNLLTIQEPSEEEIILECEKIGWKKPKTLDGSSTNCTLNAFSNLLFLSKNNFHPYEQELSILIRKGIMKREEAIKKVFNFGLEQTIFQTAKEFGYGDSNIHELLEEINKYKEDV